MFGECVRVCIFVRGCASGFFDLYEVGARGEGAERLRIHSEAEVAAEHAARVAEKLAALKAS